MVLLAELSHAGSAPLPIERYIGTAYPRGGSKVLYREAHFVYQAQGEQRQLVMYRCPNGATFARKLLHDSPASASPAFDFVDGRSGYREGVRSKDGTREVYVQEGRDAPVHTEKLPKVSGAVIDAGFDTYVRAHWDMLGKATATMEFLVPSRLRFMKIRLSSSAIALDTGEPARRLRMQLDTWYGFVLPEIDLNYSLSDRRLRQFEGIGSIRDDQGRNQNLRIEFPEGARENNVPQTELDEALAAPLVGRCRA
jgi:hypothetical protein